MFNFRHIATPLAAICCLTFLSFSVGCSASFQASVAATVPPPVLPPASPQAPMEGLDYWLPFTDNAGDMVRDVTGNGHDGAIGGTGLGATWAGRVGLVVNDSTVTVPNASGRATFGMCAYFPAGGSPPIPGFSYSYLYGLAVNGQNGYDLRTSSGPAAGIYHGALAYYPSLGRSNGPAETQSSVGFSGDHCVEMVADATDHIVVDGAEVAYLTQGSTTDGIGGAQLLAPMYIRAGNGEQFGVPITVYSVWGAAGPDTVDQAALRTLTERSRLQSLGVPFGLPLNTATDSTCGFDGTSIDVGYKASGNRTSSFLQLDFPCTIQDFSEGGQTEQEMGSGFEDRLGKVYHPLAAKNIAYNGGVINSLTVFQESPADALADLLAWNAKAHALGYKTIASTMLSTCVTGQNGAAGDVQAQAFNDLLLGVGEQFDWVTNNAAWPQIGATNACNPGGYFPDGVHVDTRGQALLAANEQAAFEGVYATALTSVNGAYTQLPADRSIVAGGTQPFDVSLMEANSASFNSAGRVCIRNGATANVRVKPLQPETIDGQAIVELAAGQTLCIRPQVVDATVGGARWTIY